MPGGGYNSNLPKAGYFVSFEGIDGSGKTTQIETLVARLAKLGVDIKLAQEPGGTAVGRLIRSVLLDSKNHDIQPMAELLLFFASRVQNLEEVIRPALAEGKLVVCDRFTDATVAYQGYGRNLGEDLVQRLSEVACQGMQPDLTVWLDIEPAGALARARDRNAGQDSDENRMESQALDFFIRVREGYARIQAADPGRVLRVDASGSAETVSQRVLDAVLPAIEKHGLAKASS